MKKSSNWHLIVHNYEKHAIRPEKANKDIFIAYFSYLSLNLLKKITFLNFTLTAAPLPLKSFLHILFSRKMS